MHFEILVEDQSGKRLLDILVPKILGEQHTVRIFAYKGIGRIPGNLRGDPDPKKRFLLEQLPGLLRGYGKIFAGYGPEYQAVVVVVCDLDRRCQKEFRDELLAVLNACDPAPPARFCLAIEECEAWLLGDRAAVKAAYPKAKKQVLDSYVQDSICGTWEKLADAIFPGGAKALKALGWQTVGARKSEWAESIAPLVDVEGNNSPSFQYLRGKLRAFAGGGLSAE